MSPWIGNGVFLVGMVWLIAIRAPHESRSKAAGVAESRKGALEVVLLTAMAIGFLVLPLLALTPLLAFADYEPPVEALVAGACCMAASLWLFHRSHRDLGSNWSVTLELRPEHALVEHGVYRYVRHPMYTALFFYGFAQTLLISNWLGGPACLVAFTLMFALRLGPEERMMLDRFGADYRAYQSRTKRLVPWLW